MTLDIAAIKARADKAAAGVWVVLERQHSYRFKPSKPEYKGEGFHTETLIITAYNDPQAKAPYTIIGQSRGIGVDGSPWITFVKIEPNDADFIAHARTDIPALIAVIEASEAARVKAEQERDAEARKRQEWQDRSIFGDKRITALEQERDALKAENARFRSGLNTLANSYYKDDQHQDYAMHVLEAKP